MNASSLLQSIDSVRRRARALSVGYGVGVTLAGAIGLLVAVVVLDYLLNLPAVPRLLVMLMALGGMAYLARRYVALTAQTQLSRSDVAGRLERAFPQFEDRLRSTVQFVERHGEESSGIGSGVLQQRVIDQATTMAADVDLGSAIVAKPAILSLTSAAVALIALILMAGLLNHATLAIITSRLLTPFSAMAWPKRVQIDLAAPTPKLVAVGQKIGLGIHLARGDRASMQPILYYRVDNGPVQQLIMPRAQDGNYETSLDARLEANQPTGHITAWIEAGDDRKDIQPITVVPRLAIRTITAEAQPPAYAVGRPKQTQDLSVAPLVTTEGSKVAVAINFNKPLPTEHTPSPNPGYGPQQLGRFWPAKPYLEMIGEQKAMPSIQWSYPAPDTAVATFVAAAPIRFRVHATDADGFTNTALEEYELIVKPDTNLSIQLEKPRQSEERTATSYVPLQAVVEDDCGVDSVKLVIDRLAPSPKHWELPMLTAGKPAPRIDWLPVESTPERVRFRETASWELNTLQLSAGDVIEYALVAQDNFDLNGRRHDPVSTSKLRITIVTPDELAARVADEIRSARTQTSIVRMNQQRNQQETQQLAEDTKKKPDFDPADESVSNRLSQQQSSIAASTKQLSSRIQQSLDRLGENRIPPGDLQDVAKDVQQTLDQASEGPMKDATEKLNNAAAPQAAKPDRDQAVAMATDQEQNALKKLDAAMAKMDTIGNLQATIAAIQDILSQQRDLRNENEKFSKDHLGQKPQDMAAPDKQKLDDIAAKQGDLGDKTQKLIDKMTKQGEQMQKSDPSASDAMKDAASQGQNAKVPQNQHKASQQTQQNQQANAQSTQQQVELGLEQMLGSLKEAQARELARLRDQMAQIQEQVATLIRRQAGHNLDNLLTQGGDALKKVDAKVLADLTEQSQRKPQDMKAPEKPLLLSPAQELTDRNTRDLAKSTDSSPQLSEVAAKLTKAAGKMDRAIMSLREGAFPAAYDPSQVEALDALIEAKKQVDAQKKEADKKQEQQQKDAIRARYEKIKAAQLLVNADTTAVEKSRGPDGNVGRAQWPTIRRLPDAQKKIADDTAAIEDDLSSLGSVVYVWANRDIKNAMVGVHDDLAASKTGVATAAEEDRITEQLDAMIKNLAEKPPEEKFQKEGGGGGGGGGKKKPQMPTEAELKLLKSLQEAVNTSTKKVAADPKTDPTRLTSLGNRQGSLRNLLGTLLDKSSKGQMKIGPEPDNKDQLPEEATASDVDDKELQESLLGDDKGGAGTQKKVDDGFKNIGTRMARSRQRLAINHDPQQVTQEIQSRILKDLDALIELAHQNSKPQSSSSGGQPGEQKKPDSGQQQANNEGQNKGQAGQPQKSKEGATNHNSAGAGSKPKDLKDITETAAEWGNVSPRVRQAVIESQGETIVEQYRKIIEDYYGALSAKGGHRPQ